MNRRSPLLIDKNILQGWGKLAICGLAGKYELLMADALFFELLSGDSIARYRCFSKLPEGENPIVLIDHIGEHLKQEIRSHKPSGKPSSQPFEDRYRFHPGLRDRDYELPHDVQQAIAEENCYLRERVAVLVDRARSVADMISERMEQLGETRPKAIENLRFQALDLPTIRRFLEGFEPPPGQLPLPPVAILDESWAIVRHAQAQLLFAIDICFRYGADVHVPTFAENRYKQLEHDVMDFEYLALAALEGAFATNEKKLRDMFRLLVPEGLLIPY